MKTRMYNAVHRGYCFSLPLLLVLLISGTPALAGTGAFFSTTTFGAVDLARFDSPSGPSTIIGPFGGVYTWDAMAFNPGGCLYAAGGEGNLIIINQETGATQLMGNAGFGIDAMAFDPSGRLFGFSSTASSTDAYEIDPQDASTSSVANFDVSVNGLTYDTVTARFLALSTYGVLYEFDPDVPSLTLPGDLGVGQENYFTSIEADPGGSVYVMERAGHIHSLDVGLLTTVYLGQPVVFDVRSLVYGPSASSPSAVEPTTLGRLKRLFGFLRMGD